MSDPWRVGRPPGVSRVWQLGERVPPNYQRRGIGSAMLAHIQQKAKARGYYILAGGALTPAVGCLKKAGFWVAGTWEEEPIYKWGYLPQHTGNDFPGRDEDKSPDQ